MSSFSTRAPNAPPHVPPSTAASTVWECCEVCGAPTLYWRNCKQVCANCRSINRSCADL